MASRYTLFDFLCVVLLAGVILAGCGGSAPGPTGGTGQSGSIDACKLITQADAEAVLGGVVKAPEVPMSGEGVAVVTSCKYTVAAAPSVDNVTLIVRRLDGTDAAKNDFDQMKKDTATQLGVTPEDVSGIGDSAFWAGGAVNELAVLKGKAELLILVKGPAAVQDAARGLADKALSRLPK